MRGLEFQLAELRKSLEEARRERDDAAAELRTFRAQAKTQAKRDAELDRLRAQNTELQASLQNDGAGEERSEEIAAQEKRLRERGQLIAKLRRDLKESDRIGREILSRLLQARPQGESNGAPTQGELGALRNQLEVLAQRCSRYEADLHAASWKIDSLTSSADDGGAASDHDKLEKALRIAHEDLAKLRRELAAQERAE